MEKTISLTPVKEGVEALTFKDLYEGILDEIKTHEELGLLEELMKQPVKVDTLDADGQVITSKAAMVIGWLENGGVLLTANIDGFSYLK